MASEDFTDATSVNKRDLDQEENDLVEDAWDAEYAATSWTPGEIPPNLPPLDDAWSPKYLTSADRRALGRIPGGLSGYDRRRTVRESVTLAASRAGLTGLSVTVSDAPSVRVELDSPWRRIELATQVIAGDVLREVYQAPTGRIEHLSGPSRTDPSVLVVLFGRTTTNTSLTTPERKAS